MKEARRFVVGPAADIPPGSHTVVPVGKFGVGVYNVNGEYFAITNYCPHRGGPLCEGQMIGWAAPGEQPWQIEWTRPGEILRCPWHQWEFDLSTGSAMVYNQSTRGYSIRTYPVLIEDGMVVLEGIAA